MTDTEILDHFYKACDPIEPAETHQFVDCSEVRGGDEFVRNCHTFISREKSGRYTALFSGHNGSGKSSELKRLAFRLQDPHQEDGFRRYLPVYIDAVDYLDEFDVNEFDILLAILSGLAGTLKEKEIMELGSRDFGDWAKELWQLLKREVDVKSIKINAGFLSSEIPLLRVDSQRRRKIRETLRNHSTPFITEVNDIFRRVSDRMRTEGTYTDFVIILDNLEKIQKVGDSPEGLESHKQLYIERSPILGQLACHTIFTVPLGLVRSCQGELNDRYSRAQPPYVLPMVKVFKRGMEEYYGPGFEKLREVVSKRVGDSDVDDVIEPKALELLIRFSGGHIRTLMRTLRQAIAKGNAIPIPLNAAIEALKDEIQKMTVNDDHWDLLVQCELNPDQLIPNNSPEFGELLNAVRILEFVNGDPQPEDAEGIGDILSDSAETRWYGVHPLIRTMRRFQKRVEEARAKDDEPS